MLKYVFAFFAFILVTLASVFADEGYIPYFPDFLEPDGIGFRGPAENVTRHCWSEYSVEEECGSKGVWESGTEGNFGCCVDISEDEGLCELLEGWKKPI